MKKTNTKFQQPTMKYGTVQQDGHLRYGSITVSNVVRLNVELVLLAF